MEVCYLVTGEVHGSLVVELSPVKALCRFSKAYPGEEIWFIRRIGSFTIFPI
jgi:hypothetical protein